MNGVRSGVDWCCENGGVRSGCGCCRNCCENRIGSEMSDFEVVVVDSFLEEKELVEEQR
jgi:hypothetical protein